MRQTIGIRSLPAAILIPLVLTCGASANSNPKRATTIFTNGAVYSMEPGAKAAQAIAISGERILFVGSNAKALRYRGRSTRVLDLKGKMVLPGFHDGHVHPLTSGVEIAQCNVGPAKSIEDLKRIITDYAKNHPEKEWITGGGWTLALFPGGNPRKDLLDSWVPDRPVVLGSFDSHSFWANSKALAMAGIDASTKDPADGRIERDEKGIPSGTLREGAMSFVSDLLPQPTSAENLAGLRLGLDMAHRFGITSLFDPSIKKDILAAYLEMDRQNQLKTRVALAHDIDLAEGPEQAAEIASLRDSIKSKWVRITSGKIFADGVIEARTAAVLDPYLVGGGNGTLNGSPEIIRDMVQALGREKLDAHVHAIGDRAVRVTLDAFEKERQELPSGPLETSSFIFSSSIRLTFLASKRSMSSLTFKCFGPRPMP